MKTSECLFAGLVFLLLLGGCSKNGGDDSCNTPPAITQVYPNNNVVGGPVLLAGQGFNATSRLRFGTVEARVLEVNERYLSAQVPAGLAGRVELSVSNAGGCSAKGFFEVVGSLPPALAASPPVYLIPPASYSFPPRVALNQTVSMVNTYNPLHKLKFEGYGPTKTTFTCTETIGPNTNIITAAHDIARRQATLNFTQRAGLPDDNLVGGFNTKFTQVNGRTDTINYFIAFSTITGRQYVFNDFK